MLFSRYFEALPATEKKDLADRLDVSLGYLYRIKGGFSRPSPQLAKRIERETKDSVRMDDWDWEAA